MSRELTRGQRAAADKARQRADEKRFTQNDLAEMVGVTLAAVNRFFNGRAWPYARTLTSYEQALGWPSGHLTRIAQQIDSGVQAIDDAAPGERRLLELVQALSEELDGVPASSHSMTVQRELKRLASHLANLGASSGGALQNVRPLQVRPVPEITADLEREILLRLDTLTSGVPGAEAIAKSEHDQRIRGLQAELELARRYGESSVTGS